MYMQFSSLNIVCFLSLLFVKNAECRILRLGCKSFADFSYIWNDYVFLKVVMGNHQVSSIEECRAKCILSFPCKAANYHNNGTCLLNNDTPSDPTSEWTDEHLTKRNNWVFMTTSYKERLVGHNCKNYNPCGEDNCLDNCECPGFQCMKCGTSDSFPCQVPFIIKHYNGLCVSYRTTNGRFRLHSDCSETFTSTVFNSLKHAPSGKCLIPTSFSNDAKIILASDCNDVNSRFSQTSVLSIEHIQTGKCVHPYGGKINPALDTDIVIHSGCNSSILQFRYIYGICAQMPCNDQGTCQASIIGYSCFCNQGYNGDNCEHFTPFIPESWTIGDGRGGIEKFAGSFQDYKKCVEYCLKTFPNANGATVDYATHKKCYCELGQTGVDHSDTVFINRRIR